jgi:hypothetical protein
LFILFFYILLPENSKAFGLILFSKFSNSSSPSLENLNVSDGISSKNFSLNLSKLYFSIATLGTYYLLINLKIKL